MSKSKETAEAEVTLKELPRPDMRAKKRGNLMYLGPTINGVARHGTVFKDGVLLRRAQECIAALPAMDRLFVEAGKVPEAVKELKNKQSVLGTIYAQAEAQFGAKNSERMV